MKQHLGMDLFITDSASLYESDKSGYKVLINGPIILKSSFLSLQDTYNIANDCHSVEISAGELLLNELEDVVKQLSQFEISGNKITNSKPKDERLYGQLFILFAHYARKKYVFHAWFSYFLKYLPKGVSHIDINLTYKNMLIDEALLREDISKSITFSLKYREHGIWWSKFIARLKNFFYPVTALFPPSKNFSDKKHIVVVIYKLSHHVDVFKRFFQLIKHRTDIQLSLVFVDFAPEATNVNYDRLVRPQKNIHTYSIKQFRTSHHTDYSDLISKLIKINPKYVLFDKGDRLFRSEVLYAWMNKMFTCLKPDVCIQMTTHEIGRVMADVARFHDVPSIQLDYALFADYFIMQSKIKYTLRASISQSVIDIWKKRKDITPTHIPIGFCKMDEMASEADILKTKSDFFKRNALNIEAKTLFFASTLVDEGAVYYKEKESIIRALCLMCHRNHWNLIIKTHPLELDSTAFDIISEYMFEGQKVFHHFEISLHDAIIYSDIITTQASSIVLEATYYEKLFCFLSTSEKSKVILASADPEITPIYRNMDEFEAFCKTIFTDQVKFLSMKERIRQRKEYVLYKTDNKASERLLDIILDLTKT